MELTVNIRILYFLYKLIQHSISLTFLKEVIVEIIYLLTFKLTLLEKLGLNDIEIAKLVTDISKLFLLKLTTPKMKLKND